MALSKIWWPRFVLKCADTCSLGSDGLWSLHRQWTIWNCHGCFECGDRFRHHNHLHTTSVAMQAPDIRGNFLIAGLWVRLLRFCPPIPRISFEQVLSSVCLASIYRCAEVYKISPSSAAPCKSFDLWTADLAIRFTFYLSQGKTQRSPSRVQSNSVSVFSAPVFRPCVRSSPVDGASSILTVPIGRTRLPCKSPIPAFRCIRRGQNPASLPSLHIWGSWTTWMIPTATMSISREYIDMIRKGMPELVF